MSRLSDFEILTELGRGSFGTAYKVLRKSNPFISSRHVVDLNIYVMKCMKADPSTLKEVSTLASINSPYIVKYMDSFIEQGNLYLIMEHCEKGDISTFLSGQMGVPLNENKIWKIALEILSGLATLHKTGIIHRDIKSKNIFLTRGYHTKIGDFGICACPTSESIKEHKQLGTLLYTSPEICKGEFYSTKTDIWSFGCVLYEICTSRQPFIAGTESAIISRIISYKPHPLPKIYSKDLGFLADACLTKDPAQRPTAAELLVLPFVHKRAVELGVELPEGLEKIEGRKVQLGGFTVVEEVKRANMIEAKRPKSIMKSILKKTSTEETKATLQGVPKSLTPATVKAYPKELHFSCNTHSAIISRGSSKSKIHNNPVPAPLTASRPKLGNQSYLLRRKEEHKISRIAQNTPTLKPLPTVTGWLRPLKKFVNHAPPPLPTETMKLYNTGEYKVRAFTTRADSVSGGPNQSEGKNERPPSTIRRIMQMNRLLLLPPVPK